MRRSVNGRKALFALPFLTAALAAQAEIIDLTAAAREDVSFRVVSQSSAKASGGYAGAEFDGQWQYSNHTWFSDPTAANPLDQWAQIQFTSSFQPGKYLCPRSYEIYYNQLHSGAGTATYPRKLPRSWTFKGSNDGENWTVLDTHTGWNNWVASTWSSFPLFTPDCYRYYRLHMTDVCNTNPDHQYYAISEIRINGEIYASEADPKREFVQIRTWTGSVSDDWFDPENWTPGEAGISVPQAGDTVRIGFSGAASVTLTNSTPELASLTVGGTAATATLTCTNWTTCVRATEVTVATGGVMTCGAASTNRADISRVWIVCSNLTVAAGGAIDVSNRGWSSFPVASAATDYQSGFGPGRYEKSRPGGAPSHGGYGSHLISWDYGGLAPLPYDDPADPSEPGSSGTTSPWARGGNGGGVVRIEATGLVTVNGDIRADGGNSSAYGKAGVDSHGSSGSGGAVNIECRALTGGGTISANGGGGGDPTDAIPGMPAGGGMIALKYNTTAQTAAAVSGLTVSAAAGLCKRENQITHNVDADNNRYEADIGTVWMSDDKILDATLGISFCGQVRGVTDYARNGDLAFSFGHVRFAEEGANVTVNGSLTLGGTDARLEIGGSFATNISAFADLRSLTPSHLTVTGDLTLGGVSRLDVRAAQRAAATEIGAFVSVGGTLTIATNCAVYAWSDVSAWGAPKFDVGNLNIATGGLFSAYRRGGLGGTVGRVASPSHAAGLGPGAGKHGQAGGGHGGNGGKSTAYNGGFAYDDEYRPSQAGSGGCSEYSYALGGYGGGLIHVNATNGTIRIDGTVSADGENATRSNGFGGGGSGGSILLEAAVFRGGETAVLTARGGDTKPFSTVGSGSGGGGRIAVWCGDPWQADLPQSRVRSSTGPLTDCPKQFQYAGVAQAMAGALLGTATTGAAGENGTVWFNCVNRSHGLLFFLK